MRSARFVVRLAVALAVVACATERMITVADPVPITLPSDAWSGSVVVLHWPAFKAGDQPPIVTIGSDTLGLQAYASDSMLVQLPDTSGSITLTARAGNGVDGEGTLDVHGFHSTYPGPIVDGTIFALPGGNPAALAIKDGRLVRLDFRLGTALQVMPDTGLNRIGAFTNCLFGGPMPSVDPGVVVVTHADANRSCLPIAKDLLSGAAPDTGPTVFLYPSMHLGRGRWLVNYKQYYRIVTGSVSAGFTQTVPISGGIPVGYVVSPRRDRVVPFDAFANGGVPVFDTVSLAPVYHLTSTTGGAAFTDGGDTLFMHGDAELLMVDATSGTILARTAVHVGTGNSGVALDPVRPFVYVAGPVNDRPVVEVFDRTTLLWVASLRIPASVPFDYFDARFGEYIIAMSSASPHLYVVVNNWGYGTPMEVLRYDVMPWTPLTTASSGH